MQNAVSEICKSVERAFAEPLALHLHGASFVFSEIRLMILHAYAEYEPRCFASARVKEVFKIAFKALVRNIRINRFVSYFDLFYQSQILFKIKIVYSD